MISDIPNAKIFGADTFVEPSEYIIVDGSSLNPEIGSSIINNKSTALNLYLYGPKYNITKRITCLGPFPVTLYTASETFTLDNTNTPADFTYEADISSWNSNTVSAWPKIQRSVGIIGTGANGAIFQGARLSIDYSGQYLVIGAPNDYGNRGTAWIVRIENFGNNSVSLSSIANVTPIEISPIATPIDNIMSTAISGDSSTVIIGLQLYGFAYIYNISQTGSVKLFTTMPQPSSAIGAPLFGTSCASSNNGSVIAIGGSGDNTNRGATWIFRANQINGSTWIEEAKIVGTGATGAARQGAALAINSAGNILVIGGPGNNSNVGAIWIYGLQSPGFWAQISIITPNSGIGNSGFGSALSISSAGDVIAVGGPGDNSGIGAIWIYRQQSGSTNWAFERKIVPTNNIGNCAFGTSVFLTPDSTKILVGGPNDNSFIGASWAYSCNNTFPYTWTQLGTKIVPQNISDTPTFGAAVAMLPNGLVSFVGGPFSTRTGGATWNFSIQNSTDWIQVTSPFAVPDAIGRAQQGISVDVDNSGKLLASGGNIDFSGLGAVWLFRQTFANTWAQYIKITGEGLVGNSGFGRSISLSKNSLYIASAGPFDNGDIGAVWPFFNNGNSLIQLGTKIVPNDNIGGPNFGTSINFSFSGDYLAIGGPQDNSGVGATWIYTITGANDTARWAKQQKIIGTGATGLAEQGTAVSISSQGDYLAIGGPRNNTNVGAVWIYTRSGTTWTQQQIITPSSPSGPTQRFGASVSLDAPALTLVVGGPNDNSGVGSVWVCTRAAAVWTVVTKIVPPDNIISAGAGTSVAINNLGNIIAFGGPSDNSVGAVWIYTLAGTTWTYRQKHTPTYYPSSFGAAIALTPSGSFLAIGGPTAASNTGGVEERS